MKMATLNVLLLTILTVAARDSAQSAAYHAASNPASDTVHFQSSAKLEFVEGLTSNIIGSIEVNPDSAIGDTKGIFRVDLRTLQTGIDLRDEHMRTRHLETDKYPFAYFEISSISNPPAQLKIDSTYQVAAAGKFYIRGIWRSIAVTTSLRRIQTTNSETLSVRAKFSLKLDEFGIPRPKALFLKLAETINVEVIFTAANNLPAPTITLPDWPEKK